MRRHLRDDEELLAGGHPRRRGHAPPAMCERAFTLDATPKYVVSSTRAVVLLGSGKLETALDRLDVIDE